MRRATITLGLAFSVLAGCGAQAPSSDSADATAREPRENWSRDSVKTKLAVDVASREGVASLLVSKSSRVGASFDVKGLEVLEVTDPATGAAVPHRVVDGRLDVAAKARSELAIDVRYRFAETGKFEGAMSRGMTFTWPYFCGNLFPCKSDPADGLAFELAVTGVPEGQTAVCPEAIETDAPPYMLAWTVGEYRYEKLGVTPSGIEVGAYALPGDEAAMATGTEPLVDAFAWLEATLGPYRFGTKVASVTADWGAGGYGGMEHHPYWHVARGSLADAEVHVHEAAHGWFGDGVRIACWEDLALSEGVASYLAARAIEGVRGRDAGDAVWADYQARLESAVASRDTIAHPESCGAIDVLDGLFGSIPYMKGAFFLRAVEAEVGREALDGVLRGFYAAHGGRAAGVQDLLDAIEADTGFDPGELARGWLHALGTP